MTSSATGRARRVRVFTDVPAAFTFAAWLLIVAGVLYLMVGGIAVWESDWVLAEVTFDNLEAWGWGLMAWGALQVAAGGLSLSQHSAGQVAGVVLAGFSIVLWLGFLFSEPVAAIVGIALDAAVIYGLTRVDAHVA